MKKQKSKIKLLFSLNKETIVKLNEVQLSGIAGGADVPNATTTVSSCNVFTCNPDNCAAKADNEKDTQF